jgi:hypothetical protein
MIGLPSSALEECFGIGVAGNFAGHLEQAGEAADFVDVAAAPEAPKGIFPFYLPGDAGFLGQFPLSGYALTLPRTDQPLNLQIEPEAGVLCEISYEGGVPAALTPRALGAFNDCSIRRPGAKKISEKKNWGVNSKGFAPHVFQLEEIDAAGATSSFRLAARSSSTESTAR